jgi:hypothetical protein
MSTRLRTAGLAGAESHARRMLRELLDRGYGRSRQAMEISAPAGVRIRFDDYGPPR